MFDVRSSARRRRLPPCSDILRLALTDHFYAIALMSSGCISWMRRNRTSGSLRASRGHRGQKRALFPKPERTGSGFGISTAATAVPARAMNSYFNPPVPRGSQDHLQQRKRRIFNADTRRNGERDAEEFLIPQGNRPRVSGVAFAHVVNSLGGMNGVDSHLQWFVTGSGRGWIRCGAGFSPNAPCDWAKAQATIAHDFRHCIGKRRQ